MSWEEPRAAIHADMHKSTQRPVREVLSGDLCYRPGSEAPTAEVINPTSPGEQVASWD